MRRYKRLRGKLSRAWDHERHARVGAQADARDRDPQGGGRGPGPVQAQFLIDALVLGTGGGALGVALGLAASRIVSRIAGWETVILPGTLLVAFAGGARGRPVIRLLPARQRRLDRAGDPLTTRRGAVRDDRRPRELRCLRHGRRRVGDQRRASASWLINAGPAIALR
jgi:hypothetical protein